MGSSARNIRMRYLLEKNIFPSKIFNSEFGKNTITLTGGTILAQILPFIFYPILGRIFNPAEFGLLATIASIIPFVAILASGMYENAILLADSKHEAADLVGMILWRGLLITLILGILLIFISPLIAKLFKESEFKKWLFVVPIAAYATVIYNVFNEWCVSNKYFKNLSLNKINFTSSITLSKVGFGILGISGNGLILGDLIGKLATSLSCIYRGIKLDKEIFLKIKFSNFTHVSKKYKSFSHYLMPDQILNNIVGFIHIIFIGAYFSITELGYISLVFSLLTVPVTVISASIKDVFRQRANIEYIETGNCRHTYLMLLKPITVISVFLFIPLFFLLPYVFPVFLGAKWSIAGKYAQLLLPMFIANFISMSLGGVLIIARKLNVSLLWQVFTIVTSIIAFVIGIFVFNSFFKTIICYMIARTSSYILYIFISYHYAKA